MDKVLTPITTDLADRNSATLADAIRSKNQIYVFDNSMLSSFVRGEAFDVHQMFNLAELWYLERRHLETLMGLLDEDITFPKKTIAEFTRGIERLEKFAGNPREALQFKWGKEIECLDTQDCQTHREVKAQACDEYRRSLELMKDLSYIMPVLPSEAYVNPKFRGEVPRILKVLEEEIVTDKERTPRVFSFEFNPRPNQRNRGNDREIISSLIGIAYTSPVSVVTRDGDFKKIVEKFYENIGIYSAKYGFRVNSNPVSVVLRKTSDLGPKRTSIYRNLVSSS